MTFLADALPRLTEKQWMQQVITLAEMLGYRCYHTFDSRRSTPGLPDILAVRRPRVIWFETKAQRGRATPDQLWWIGELKACGQEVYIIRPSDIERLTRILRGSPGGRS